MAAPEFVPTKLAKPGEDVRVYESPPRRPDTWWAQRPADFAEDGRQPVGERLGNPGPDQGYGLKLGRLLEPELHLSDGEHARDAVAGIVAVGLKRASIIGRAPVMHDMRLAATIFGYLDPAPDAELVRLRTELFEEVGHFHHYAELRGIADMVDPAVLRLSPAEAKARYDSGWRDQLTLDV